MDLEISPHLTYTYDTYDTNVVKMVRPQFLLSFAYKTLGAKKVEVVALPDFTDHYRKRPYCDKLLAKALWNVIDEADVIIGHNMQAFDLKKANARFLFHGLPSPSPVMVIDTLKIARRVASFPGNSLSKLADFLGVEQGKLHFGIEQWVQCIEGDLQTWKREKEYNKRDINVTEEVYMKLRSYIPNHMHMHPENTELACHVCASTRLIKRGFRRLVSGAYRQRFLCKECGTYTADRRSVNLTANKA